MELIKDTQFENSVATANSLRKALPQSTLHRPIAGIVCGSGLDEISYRLKDKVVIPFEEIAGFGEYTADGHVGQLIFGILGSTPVVCLVGRLHYYEGWGMKEVVYPVRVLQALGIKLLILTNAAGALNPKFNLGDVMIIEDHIGLPILSGMTPLRGPNDSRLGERFTSLSNVYPVELRRLAASLAASENLYTTPQSNAVARTGAMPPSPAPHALRAGNYVFVSGPQFQTGAEMQCLHAMGADAVGMSTVPEAIAAAHAGIPVLAFSLISDTRIPVASPTFSSSKDDPHEREKPREENNSLAAAAAAATASPSAAAVVDIGTRILAQSSQHGPRLFELIEKILDSLPSNFAQ